MSVSFRRALLLALIGLALLLSVLASTRAAAQHEADAVRAAASPG